MIKCATPVKQNQGTDVDPTKIILAMPKFVAIELTTLRQVTLISINEI